MAEPVPAAVVEPDGGRATAGPRPPAAWPVVVAAWTLLVATSLAARPLLPVDETRYLSVAWEMWRDGDFLVPHLNGQPYSHKPPLLFWLFQVGWAAFGVSAWWPRLVSPLCALATLALVPALARRLWPGRPGIAALAPLVLSGGLLWCVFTTFVMFDLLLTVCVALALLGVALAWRGAPRRGWTLAALGLGLGALAKGPVVLASVLPVMLLAPWWMASGPRPRWGRWYAGAGSALLGAHALALAWALPAARSGGPAYTREILFGQTSGRLVQSFAHQRPWWWYLALAPFALFPYVAWPPSWRAAAGLRRRSGDGGIRFCLAVVVPAFVAFSAISGKQEHYLLSLLPAVALLLAAGFEAAPPHRGPRAPALWVAGLGALVLGAPIFLPGRLPAWVEPASLASGACLLVAGAGLAWLGGRRATWRLETLHAVTLAVVVALHLGLAIAAPAFDPRPVAAHLRRLEAAGHPLAFAGTYHGEFQFLGRLERPLAVLHPGMERRWLEDHPGGRVVAVYARVPPHDLPAPELEMPYRGQRLAIWTLGVP